VANPLASVLSEALLLEISFGLKEEAEKVIRAVDKTLKQGYRTVDIADKKTANEFILGTDAMGQKVLQNLG
jgi:3-isopropylmalate dehydrogenase